MYHCFPLLPIGIGPFPFFVSLFVPIQYPPSIFFDPFHQSLPLCIFNLVLGFSFPILPLLFPISCSPFSYFPVEVPSQEYVFIHCVFDTFSCCLHLFTVYCPCFPPFIAYMNFSFHTCFFFSLFISLFFNPQFHPCYYSPGSSSVAIFPFVLLFRFPFSLSNYVFIHLLFIPFLAAPSSLILSLFYIFFLIFPLSHPI
jgi:hypothetical protein